MKIYSDKDYHGIIIVSVLLLVATAVLMWFEEHDVFGFLLILFIMPLLILCWIALCRTLCFDSDGITVRFLCWKHFYLWSEMKLKRIEDFPGAKAPYVSGAVFSTKQTDWPKWMNPLVYSIFFHPFSFVFIQFDPMLQQPKGRILYSKVYNVDEEKFRKHMSEWGIF